MHHDRTLELVGSIYDAAFEPELWPETLIGLSEAVGGVQECLQAHSSQSQSFAMVAPRRDPDDQQRFHQQWMKDGLKHGCAQMIERLFAAPVGRVLDFRQLFPPEEFARTAFYNDWWQRQRLGQAALIVKLTTSDHTWRICGLHKGPNDDFTDEEMALLEALAPHLARAFALQSEIAGLTARQEIGAKSSKPGRGTICVDRDGNIVFADDDAEALLRTVPGIGLEQGRLALAQPDAAAELDRLIASCADLTLGPGGPGGALMLMHSDRSAPVRVEVLPIGMSASWHNISFFGLLRPVAILTIFDPEVEAAERKRMLQGRFGLTPAEAAFTLEILKGDGREAAAARSGITLSTARTHLTRIFDKVGVRRQAELVRLLSDGMDNEPER